MRSQAAVACHSSPFVFQNVHLVAAGGDHGLNGDDHAVTQGHFVGEWLYIYFNYGAKYLKKALEIYRKGE